MRYSHLKYVKWSYNIPIFDKMTEPAPRIELVQHFHELGSPEKNLAIIEKEIGNSKADLVVFPEMFLTGYTLGRDVVSLSQTISNEYFERIGSLCGSSSKYALLGFPESSSFVRGQIHNSAALIGPEGLEGVYRKNHLVDFGPFEEWSYFTPGDEPFMFEIEGYSFGVIICYDIFFPELTKHYAINGADGVICISASPAMTRPYFEAVMKARAIENTIYFFYSNLVGFDSRMDFWGGAEIIDPRGKTLAKAPYFQEAKISTVIDPTIISKVRIARPTLRDTKPEMKKAMGNWLK